MPGAPLIQADEGRIVGWHMAPQINRLSRAVPSAEGKPVSSRFISFRRRLERVPGTLEDAAALAGALKMELVPTPDGSVQWDRKG